MSRRVYVPIRVERRPSAQRARRDTPPVTEAVPPIADHEPVTPVEPDVAAELQDAEAAPSPFVGAPSRSEVRIRARAANEEERGRANEDHQTQQAMDEESVEVWRDRALRLQAEMENFRKRQRRLLEERILSDRKELLRSFLPVSDDLERALAAGASDVESLRQGIDLTYRCLTKALDQAGVKRLEAVGQPFDPAWHEAVSTVPHQEAGVEPGTVVEVVQAGYRLDGRLLRPARVVVAT